MISFGEPVGFDPLIRCGECEPWSDPGFSAGSPIETYDGERDARESVLEAIRARVVAGGPRWAAALRDKEL